MLKELRCKNFLSYEDTTVSFDGSGTIAVVGENGHGKSGLLEAIHFCLFGGGRGDLQSLIRIGSSGDMRVRLVMTDIPTKGKEVIVERGIKDSGGGFTKVWLDGNLMASGGAKPSPNKAQDFINSLLGTDEESFMLTSFFGMGANDTLMQVRPSERLETLQKLAGVDVCMKFHDLANERAKTFAENAERDRYAAANIRVFDKGDLDKEYKVAANNQAALRNRVDELLSKRTSMLKDEDRYRGLTTERESIRAKREALLKQKDREEQVQQREKQDWEDSVQTSHELSEKRKTLEVKMSEMRTMKKIKEEYDAIQSKKAELDSAVALRNTALAGSHAVDRGCPLCGGAVDADVHKRWKNEVAELVSKVGEAKARIAELVRENHVRTEADKEFESLRISLETLTRDGTRAEEKMKEAERELEKINTEISKIESRLTALKKEMVDYEEVVKQMREIDGEMADAQNKLGKAEQEVIHIKDEIKENDETVEKLKDTKKRIEAADTKARGYKIIADAFSRYAIPVQLLSNLRAAIEKRASIIYQHFNSGVIQVRDTGGAKPGVEFVLVDEMGERPYKALSSGEKVMVFLAVRVALTQIINASRNNKIDFLILDEVAGNLSPVKRDSLTRLINVLLRKFFPQIFMVSHVELRDIFNKTLKVTKTEGISYVS